MVDCAPDSATECVLQCGICYDSVGGEYYQGCCGDSYCKRCMQRAIITRVQSGALDNNGFIRRLCSCGNVFTNEEIATILADAPAQLKLYRRIAEARQVAANPNLLFCATPGCENFLTRPDNSKQALCEHCNRRTCVDCNGQHSSVLPCVVVGGTFVAWKAGGGASGEGVKRCPKCKSYIEKAEGCRHMTCWNCKHEFCWHCRSPWNEGCKSARLCRMNEIWGSSVWGNTLTKRCATKTLAAPCVVVAAGVGATLLAAGAACAVVGATLRLPVEAGAWVYKKSRENATTRNSEHITPSRRTEYATHRKHRSLNVMVHREPSDLTASPAAASPA